MAVWLRTAKHSTVTVAAISVVASQAWPTEICVSTRPRLVPNSAQKENAVPETLRKVKNAVIAEATVQRAAPAAAMSSARP